MINGFNAYTTHCLQDTAGEEKFAAITSLYCCDTSVVLLAYDITKLESFKKLQNVFVSYLDFVQTVCLNVVVGCKLDLIDTNKQPREVDEQLGRGLAEVLHKNQLEKVLLYYINFSYYTLIIIRMKKQFSLI